MTKSQKGHVTHGQSRNGKPSRIFMIWTAMKQRCFNQRAFNYDRYGGRGITVCERWMQFENFYADMGEKPDGMSLDRIDNNKGYSPDNCRWATAKEQQRNTRVSRMLTFNGKTMPVAAWTEFLGVHRTLIPHRLKRGWSVERALTTPAAPQFHGSTVAGLHPDSLAADAAGPPDAA